MKAILWTKYGSADGLELRDVEKPQPTENQVLIKLFATTVTAGDCEMRSLNFPPYLAVPIRMYAGLIKPKRITILGQELAGKIESIGKNVSAFKVDDAVFAGTGFGMGAYAEYICFSEKPDEMEGVLALKPSNLSYEQAACIPTGGLEALHFLRQADIQKGERVLINGAGGSIGTIAIQLAKYYGAEVTGVDNTEKLEMLLSIGADRVIDYITTDFTKTGQTYDVILDVIGKSPFSRSMQALNENGRYLLANPKLRDLIRAKRASRKSSKKVIYGAADRKTEDLLFLAELIEAGKIIPVIDRRFPLEETAAAHRYLESGVKKGNVCIVIIPQ